MRRLVGSLLHLLSTLKCEYGNVMVTLDGKPKYLSHQSIECKWISQLFVGVYDWNSKCFMCGKFVNKIDENLS